MPDNAAIAWAGKAGVDMTALHASVMAQIKTMTDNASSARMRMAEDSRFRSDNGLDADGSDDSGRNMPNDANGDGSVGM